MTPVPREELLTISDLSERTGVPAATLRSWESRYGFPQPSRLAGGHRRYAERDVDAVLQVLRHRDEGFALDAAVRRVRSEPLQSRSLYAELRRQFPELPTQALTKRTLLALSHAIEDECCARAETPVLFGGFQRGTFLRASYARWVELARTARVAVVFADMGQPAHVVAGLPVEVALPHEAPLNREWIVLCDAADLPACMVAVERPGQEAAVDGARRYDALWTVDPRVVRHASRVAAALAQEYRPALATLEIASMSNDPAESSADLRRASGLLTRTMTYLDARL